MINIDDPKQTETTPAIWRLGFRPFFLGGSVVAAIYIPLWLVTWLLPQYSPFNTSFWAKVLPLWWHPHELLFGFAMAIVAGFLLTAVQNWTNQPSLKGWPLALTFGCWALARLLLLLPMQIPVLLPALFDALFLSTVAITLWRCIYRVKQWRNIGFPIMIFAALGINLYSYYTLLQRDFIVAHQIWQAMLWWLALLITIVGGRVIAFFTAMRIKATKAEPLPWIEYPLIAAMLLLVLQALTDFDAPVLKQALLVIAGVLHLIRFSRWLPHKTLKEPMLWSLHLAYVTLPISLLLMSWYIDDEYAYRCLLHLFAIGCMAMLCLSMISRVSLGHTSRNIYEGPNMRLGFICLPLAAVFRALMPIYFPENTSLWLWLAAGCWFGAFALFVWHYTPILTRPRIDGRPG
ncbi:NnrS family protein [Shewanella acanthi]|uniref:NnrS family protein n=1 Tax=Shewanella acanthi TaxID=2864212 RepID=UPI001C661354|nr:NnrS family protein [Shewanella acanthi]QYJ77940.1 NnrS family protein [Shewanella acanthi]